MTSRTRAFTVAAIALLFAATPVSAMTAGDSARLRTIRGTVRVVGNEPFTQTVVTTDDEGDISIRGPLEKELRARFQGKRVTLEGRPCEPAHPAFRKGFEPSRIVEARNP